jgi:glycosyltransferase involved in cell wall biosynthesis
VPTCNRPLLLHGALASIRALEGPDLVFEIIVSDNGGPGSHAVAEEFGAIYVQTTAKGAAAARNEALRRATGEFIAFLDDDDEWLPANIRPHIARLDADAGVDAVFGQMQLTDEHLKPYGPPWPLDLPADQEGVFIKMMSGYHPQLGATVVRGDIVARFGLMDESLIGGQDWDWQLRIVGCGRVAFVKTPCVLFRQREQSSFDKLQIARVRYTRKIFWRHAWPNRKRWPSPVEMARSFFNTQHHYFAYFAEAAQARAEAGNRAGALAAIWNAFWVFPTRAARGLIAPSPIRGAIAALFSPARTPRSGQL